jgi:hypothetical protein
MLLLSSDLLPYFTAVVAKIKTLALKGFIETGSGSQYVIFVMRDFYQVWYLNFARVGGFHMQGGAP